MTHTIGFDNPGYDPNVKMKLLRDLRSQANIILRPGFFNEEPVRELRGRAR